MNVQDFIGPPCSCAACGQAGVTDKAIRRDPHTGEMLHGYRLKRWYDAFENFRTRARQAVGERGRHAHGFERVAHPSGPSRAAGEP